MIEREKTFLLKYFPPGLAQCRHVEMIDHYIPMTAVHPVLRIRKQGDQYMITKKVPLSISDASVQEELTIPLTIDEYNALIQAPHNIIHKTRYYYDRSGYTVEIDIFAGMLTGLAVADIECPDNEALAAVTMPPFCLADITQDHRIAGGILAGKEYDTIYPLVEKYHYQKLSLAS